MFKINNKDTRTGSGVFIVNFKYISKLFLVPVVDFEQVIDCLDFGNYSVYKYLFKVNNKDHRLCFRAFCC